MPERSLGYVEREFFMNIHEDLRVKTLQLIAPVVANAAFEFDRLIALSDKSPTTSAFVIWQRLLPGRSGFGDWKPTWLELDHVPRRADSSRC